MISGPRRCRDRAAHGAHGVDPRVPKPVPSLPDSACFRRGATGYLRLCAQVHLAGQLADIEGQLLVIGWEDVAAGFLSCQASLVLGVKEVLVHLVYDLADSGDRLCQSLPTGSKLLDLGVQAVATLGKVGQHASPQLLCFLDHGATFATSAIQQRVGLETCLLQMVRGFFLCPAPDVGGGLVGSGGVLCGELLRVRLDPFGLCLRLSPALLCICFGSSHHLGRCVTSRSQHPGGLLPEHRGHSLLVECRIGCPALGISERLAELSLAFHEHCQLAGHGLEEHPHLGGVETPACRRKGVLGNVLGRQSCRGGYGESPVVGHGQSLRRRRHGAQDHGAGDGNRHVEVLFGHWEAHDERRWTRVATVRDHGRHLEDLVGAVALTTTVTTANRSGRCGRRGRAPDQWRLRRDAHRGAGARPGPGKGIAPR